MEEQAHTSNHKTRIEKQKISNKNAKFVRSHKDNSNIGSAIQINGRGLQYAD